MVQIRPEAQTEDQARNYDSNIGYLFEPDTHIWERYQLLPASVKKNF